VGDKDMPSIKCPECKVEVSVKKGIKGSSTKSECPNCFAEISIRQIGDQCFAEVANDGKEVEKEWEADDVDQEGAEEDD